MNRFLDKLLEIFNIGKLIDSFRDNEGFLMTKGLTILAFACIGIAIFYAIVLYGQLSDF